MILTTEFIGARAFLFHTDLREGGHLYGDVLMMDLDTLRQDIKRNILYPCGVNIERKDGSVATVSLKEWTGMELYEKDALKSWGFSYAPRIKLRNGSTTIPRCSDSGWIRHFVICPRI